MNLLNTKIIFDKTTTQVDDKVDLKKYLKNQQLILEDLDDLGLRKQNPNVEEVCRILEKNPNCMHAMDYKFIVPPKESKDKHFIPQTKQNDLNKYTSWKQTLIVVSRGDIGHGKSAPSIADTKAAILSIGGVLDGDVEIWRLPEFVMNTYMGPINKKLFIPYFVNRRKCHNAH